MNDLYAASQFELCRTLRTLVEEWGPDRVSVRLPEEWRDMGENPLGAIAVEFARVPDSIAICVDSGKMLNLEYSLDQFGLALEGN